MSNTYKETRLRWEKEQERLHGCCSVNGTCMVHGGAQPEKKEQEPPKTVELPLFCTCRSFNHPHLLGAHDELGCDYDWRTPGGRERETSDPDNNASRAGGIRKRGNFIREMGLLKAER